VSGFIAELRRRNVLRVGTAYLVVGWLILQFVDVVFPILGLDEALGRPILALLLVGLPIALRTGRMLDRSIIIILIFAVGLLLVDKFVLQQEAEPQQQLAETRIFNSIAVLPFDNLSGEKEDEYFSDGLTETLLHMLAQVPDLNVAARTSVFSFKDKKIDIREIAESLGVETVLEGSVQRSGNKVRITAQLIEAKDGFHLWSQTFDRDFDDIFSVQDEIATSVAAALQLTLQGGATADAEHGMSLATKDAQAYEKYLQGLEQKHIASYGSLPQAEGFFKEALALDPDFIEAKVELASTYRHQSETGILGGEEAEQKIRPLIDQVLQLNPEDGRALGMLASLDWQNAVIRHGPVSEQTLQAEADLKSAIKLAPNDPDLYFTMSLVAQVSNRNEESLEWIDKGLSCDPLSARLHLQRGRLLLGALERPEDAEEAFAKGREIAPEWTAVNFESGNVAFSQGRFADGISWYQRAMALDPQDHELPSIISNLYYRLGLNDEGDEMLRRAQALAPQEPRTRRAELEMHLHADNYERAAILAEEMLRDDIENRAGTFNVAVIGYVSSMIDLDRASAVADFFESLMPGISGADYAPPGANEAFMQFMLVQALVNMGSFETANEILDSLIVFADLAIPGWRDNDYVMATVAMAQGDQETAVEYALQDLDEPLGTQLDWSFNYLHVAWMKPLLKDEQIAKRVAELEAETQAAGDEIRVLLAGQQSESR
jgi:TolB-like protein/thioredoxin-like negative regulator of GroEL